MQAAAGPQRYRRRLSTVHVGVANSPRTPISPRSWRWFNLAVAQSMSRVASNRTAHDPVQRRSVTSPGISRPLADLSWFCARPRATESAMPGDRLRGAAPSVDRRSAYTYTCNATATCTPKGEWTAPAHSGSAGLPTPRRPRKTKRLQQPRRHATVPSSCLRPWPRSLPWNAPAAIGEPAGRSCGRHVSSQGSGSPIAGRIGVMTISL